MAGVLVEGGLFGVLGVRGVVVVSSSIGVEPSWAANRDGEGVCGVVGMGGV